MSLADELRDLRARYVRGAATSADLAHFVDQHHDALQAALDAQVWTPVAERLPDDDLTVLLLMEDGEVWSGFHDGDNGWRYVSADPASAVKAWRPMPGGEG